MSDTWQDRLVQERNEAIVRLQKLQLFQTTDKHSMLPTADIMLLSAQESTMECYIKILNMRVTNC